MDAKEMKKAVMQSNMDNLKSETTNDRVKAAKFLGDSIGIGKPTGLEKEARIALSNVATGDKKRRVRKAAEEAMQKIKARTPVNPVVDMLSMFSGGVVFTSDKGGKRK